MRKARSTRADLTPGEDEELAERISLLQNSEKIFAGIETAYGLLNEGEASAMSALGGSLRALQGIAEYSKEVPHYRKNLLICIIAWKTSLLPCAISGEKITFTPEELDQAISRLDLIENLKKKYGSNVEEILAYRDRISEELNQIENFDEVKASLEKETSACYDSLKKQADLLTAARQKGVQLSWKSPSRRNSTTSTLEKQKARHRFQNPDVIGP